MVHQRQSNALAARTPGMPGWLGSMVLTKGRGDANDEAFAGGELLGQVDLITGGPFDEVDVGDGSTDFDHGDGCGVEGSNRCVCGLTK